MIDFPPEPTVIQQLAHCGLEAKELKVEFDDVLQSDIVTVSPRAGATPEMFVCIRHMAWGKVDTITFADEQMQAAYSAFDREAGAAEITAQSRAWLSWHGKLETLPTFELNQPIPSILKSLEEFCSIEPGTAFEFRPPHLITLKQSFLGLPPKKGLDCLMHAMQVVDLKSKGLRFGFIGNESLGDGSEK